MHAFFKATQYSILFLKPALYCKKKVNSQNPRLKSIAHHMIIGIGGFLYIMFITVAWVLTIYTLNFYYLSYQSRHNVSHEKRQLRRTEVNDDLLPTVTVQLPLYNEKYVASRLIEAVCNMDYPKDKLSIQIP